jgi:hypothetical protein
MDYGSTISTYAHVTLQAFARLADASFALLDKLQLYNGGHLFFGSSFS